MRKILLISLTLASAAALLSSCEKFPRDGKLRFNVYTNDTKGDITTTSSIQTDGNTFVLNAWLEAKNRGGSVPTDNDNPWYVKNADMTLSGKTWSGTATWRNVVWTNFWASYPKTVTGRGEMTWPASSAKDITDAQEKTPSFTYDMSSYTSGTAAASTTPDILVAYARGMWNEDEKSGGEISFQMEHTLSAIKFAKGHVDNGYTISNVKIAGVYTQGTCSLTGFTRETDLKDAVSVAWTGTGTPDKTVGFTQALSDEYYTGSKYIFVIPQALPNTAILSAEITGGDPEKAGTKEVAISGYSWKPGYKYAYTLSFYADKNELNFTVSEYSTSTGTWTD